MACHSIEANEGDGLARYRTRNSEFPPYSAICLLEAYTGVFKGIGHLIELDMRRDIKIQKDVVFSCGISGGDRKQVNICHVIKHLFIAIPMLLGLLSSAKYHC